MIVWGGGFSIEVLNTGGRYNPGTGNCTASSQNDAREPGYHTAAWWTGIEMIIWCRNVGPLSGTGGRYYPTKNSLSSTSLVTAPEGREYLTAVWTGTEMIIWGGGLNTGGRYDPVTNSWTATSTTNAPE